MSSINDRTFRSLRSDISGLIGDAFLDATRELVNEVKDRAKELQSDFIYDLTDSVGQDDSPPEIGVAWAPLTLEWADRKAARGITGFYLGFKGQYGQAFSRGIESIAGKPEVFISEKGGSGFIRSEGNRFRDLRTGRFTKAIEAPREATLNVNLFPKFKNDSAVIDRFAGGRGRRLARKMGALEFGSSRIPARPFLSAFERYYREVNLTAVLERI